MVSLLLNLNKFQKLSSLSIVDFEKVNGGSDVSLGIFRNFPMALFFSKQFERTIFDKIKSAKLLNE